MPPQRPGCSLSTAERGGSCCLDKEDGMERWMGGQLVVFGLAGVVPEDLSKARDLPWG